LLRVINYICYACTLISIPLTIYLYRQTVQELAPTYYISPERTRIIDTTVPAPTELKVLYKDKDLQANVNALIVYVWNDGKLSIKAENVLEPLRIELDPACEILDARLLKVSRSVAKFAKGEVSQSTKNSLPISFAILEHSDGAAIQIIYTGSPDAAAKMLGVVEGAGQPRAIESKRPTTLKEIHHRGDLARYAILALIGCVTAFIAYRLARRRRSRQPWGAIDGVFLVALALYLGMGASFAYDMYHAHEPLVPRTIWTER